ncbi:protein ROOT HAIR SPECIFIC 17-like [Humulus lupulus]|uniref:protein ROOT HAIR SPECIFIC 17-like n=1 Tax=Humulus lupulus TaxID=3486 RepID=UPI002B40D7BF|nr:protein ROOT HAIR SPECIFIC 17-like [Humulus lupulus]
MKKRKDQTNPITFGATIYRRHRRLHRHLFQLVSVFSACILLFLVAFSLLVPSPILHHRLSNINGNVERESYFDQKTEFHVPTSGESLGRDLWSSTRSELYYGCSNGSRNFMTSDAKTNPNRYLVIATSGGLNQQRTGITDAVVAAYILNATLVVPKLDQKSFWHDSSNFAEIFDVDRFISFLSKDVHIIKELPMKGGKGLTPHSMRVPRKCTPKCYLNRVLPVLNKRHVVQLSKFDYRLSNRLSKHLQKLRCRVNYHALKFTDSILEMGEKLVERMRKKSKHFIALHLRYEPDMLAFSGCDFGGGDKEKEELGLIRKRWKSLHVSNPDKVRRNGRCPLTPGEVGLMLRALGFGSDVHLYVASGEVYGGEETLAPLKELFPNFHTKETIANKEELAPFTSFSSRMAALDFIVCDESDVFVTNNNGNMARMLAGRRRYFGHKPTIRPNAKKLYKLLVNRYNMTWEDFAAKVRTSQIGFMGEPKEIKPGRGEFHENPEACICDVSDKNPDEPSPQNRSQNIHHMDNSNNKENKNKDSNDVTDEQISEDEQFWFDYLDNETALGGKRQPNATDFETTAMIKSEQPELEELFSD